MKKDYRKGVYLDIYSEDWDCFKKVCAIRGKTIREVITDLLEPEFKRCRQYFNNIPDYESIIGEENDKK